MAHRPGSRILAALLFTDIVGSTRHAEDMGDRRWRELLARHHRLLRAAIRANGGRELDTAGDGFFAMFDTPAAAIRCACEAIDSVRTLGVEIRAGVHIGECEVLDGKVSGVNVHIAARTMAVAQAGQVDVTSSVRDLVRGGGFGFADRGLHQLKGIEGEWALFEVTSVDDVPRPPPQGEEEALRRRDAVQPPSIVQRRGPRLVAIGVAGITALVVLTAAFLHSRGGPARPSLRRSSAPPLTEYVARVDPITKHVVAKVAVGRRPVAVAVGEGSAWVVNEGDGTVSRINPAKDAVTTIRVKSDPVAITIGPAGVWVATNLSKTIEEIDASNDRVERTVSLDYAPTGIAETNGAVWLVSPNVAQIDLTGIDPTSGDRIGEVQLPDNAGSKAIVAATGVNVLVGGGSGVLLDVDPSNLAVRWSRSLDRTIGGITIQGGYAWVATIGTPGEVFQLDTATGRVVSPALGAGGGGYTGGGVTSGLDRISSDGTNLWVTDWPNGTVSEIVTAGGEVEPPILVGKAAADVAAGEGAVWVTVVSPGD